jgi:hypothetical protein
MATNLEAAATRAETVVSAKLFEDRGLPGYWRVERTDEDGACEIAIFSGPDAHRRAVLYADRLYGQFDEITLAPYRQPWQQRRSL